jgi:hypothetical protein
VECDAPEVDLPNGKRKDEDMAEYDPEFQNNEWYRLKAKKGVWGKTRGESKTIFFEVACSVVGGEMAGQDIPYQIFLSKKENGPERFIASCAVLGFDARGTDLVLLPEAIVGKEFWGRCEIQAKQNGKGYWDPKIAEAVLLTDRIPGGIESEAAALLGNTVTSAPNPDAFRDNF